MILAHRGNSAHLQGEVDAYLFIALLSDLLQLQGVDFGILVKPDANHGAAGNRGRYSESIEKLVASHEAVDLAHWRGADSVFAGVETIS